MLNALVIGPGSISRLYTCSDNWSAVPQLHFLPYEHHSTGSISWPESLTKPKMKIMLEISIIQIMVMLDLLTKSWPCQQLLVALVSLTATNVLCIQKPTMQHLLSRVVMQPPRWNCSLAFPLLRTDTINRRPQTTPNWPYYTLSQSYGHMVGKKH